jgi:hypothetical protein
MRPLGAIMLGSYIGKVGRRKGLIVTPAIMALGTSRLHLCRPSVAFSMSTAASQDVGQQFSPCRRGDLHRTLCEKDSSAADATRSLSLSETPYGWR